MKKTSQTKRTLQLSRETVAVLERQQLPAIVGGMPNQTNEHSCLTLCNTIRCTGA